LIDIKIMKFGLNQVLILHFNFRFLVTLVGLAGSWSWKGGAGDLPTGKSGADLLQVEALMRNHCGCSGLGERGGERWPALVPPFFAVATISESISEFLSLGSIILTTTL
jgi:hypothetical protein